jgi:outer membrane protein OmpA-like peptidoglycan-associated protein
MLSKIFGYSALAGAAFLVGSLPALAHEGHDDMCGGVLEKDSDMVVSASGNPVLLSTSEPCPVVEQVAVVSSPAVAEPVAVVEPAAGPLPNDGVVYFDLDADQLNADDQAILDDIVSAVAERNPSSVTVMGYADRSGDDGYNMDLSERRAQTVASALQAAGIPETSISTVGYGETEPAVATEDGVAMRQNRRAEVSPQ